MVVSSTSCCHRGPSPRCNRATYGCQPCSLGRYTRSQRCGRGHSEPRRERTFVIGRDSTQPSFRSTDKRGSHSSIALCGFDSMARWGRSQRLGSFLSRGGRSLAIRTATQGSGIEAAMMRIEMSALLKAL